MNITKKTQVRDLKPHLPSLDTISTITDKIWPLVEAWQNRPLAAIYPIIYLDGLHIKLRRQSKVENIAVYIVLGVDLQGMLSRLLAARFARFDAADGYSFHYKVSTRLLRQAERISGL